MVSKPESGGGRKGETRRQLDMGEYPDGYKEAQGCGYSFPWQSGQKKDAGWYKTYEFISPSPYSRQKKDHENSPITES